MNIAFKNAPHLFRLSLRAFQFGTVINHQRHTNMVVLGIEQRGNIEVQIYLSSAWNITIDRIGDHGAVLMLHPGILQQFADTNLRPDSKNVQVVFSYRGPWVHAQYLRGRFVKSRDDTRRIGSDYTIGNRSKDIIHVLFVFVDLAYRPGQVSE